MSLMKKLKKVGRKLDDMGIARMAANQVGLGNVYDTAAKANSVRKKLAGGGGGAAQAAPDPGAASPPSSSMQASLGPRSFLTKPAVLIGALATVGALVVALVIGRRRKG